MNREQMTPVRNMLVFIIAAFMAVSCSDVQELGRLPGNAIILSFGDSLTRGKGAEENESYPAILEQLSGRRVVNAGINGELSEQGLKRLPGLLDQHQPALLIICHGGNDILQKRDLHIMADNVRAMIRLADERGLPVVLLGVPRPGLFLSAADVYLDIAESTNVIFIEDVVPDVLGDKSLKSDIAHPNADGYRAMAEGIFEVLQDRGAI